MTTPNSFLSRGATLILRLASASVLAVCALWTGIEFPAARSKTVAPANPLPTLRGREAEALTSNGAYRFHGSAQCPGINISPSSLTSGTVGTPYSQTLTTTAGTQPITFTFSGSLPPGLNLTSLGANQGLISGTPTTNGIFSFTVTATDANGCTGSQAYTLVISCPQIFITPSSLDVPGTVGVFESRTLTTTAGNQPITFTVTSGSLPPGLTLSPEGLISGFPTNGGSFSFTITATDASGCTGSQNYTIFVAGCQLITINPADLPAGAVNAPYNQTLTASGGTPPFSFSITSGSLPPGLTLSPTGIISGTPTATGSFAFTVQATDVAGCSVVLPYEVVINQQGCQTIVISNRFLPAGNIGLGYNQTLTPSGGTPPLTFSLVFGSPPPGLTLSPTGVISGTPTAIGVFRFITLVTDANGCREAILTRITITCPSISITPLTLADAQVGIQYNQTLTANGGVGPFTFNLVSGQLPPGLTLSPTGQISGAPTVNGVFSFRVQATGASPLCPVSQNYTIVVTIPTPPPTAFLENPSNNTARNVGVAGVLGALGVAIGREAGRDSSTLRCTPITVIPTVTALPAGVVGQPYSQTFTSSGGITSHTFTLKGSPPPGLILGSDGTLSGSPTAAGTSAFSVAATDSKNCGGERAYTLVVNQGAASSLLTRKLCPQGSRAWLTSRR